MSRADGRPRSDAPCRDDASPLYRHHIGIHGPYTHVAGHPVHGDAHCSRCGIVLDLPPGWFLGELVVATGAGWRRVPSATVRRPLCPLILPARPLHAV